MTSKQRRGRPSKSIDAVIAARALGTDEFVAVRAFFRGIDPSTACRQYLLAEDPPSSSYEAFRRITELASRIASIASAKKRLPEEGSISSEGHAAICLNQAAKACEDGLRKYQSAKRLAAKKNRAKLAQEAKIHGLAPLPGLKKRPALPSYLLDMGEFEIHYDRVMKPDYNLDRIELLAALEDFKSEHWRALGFYYKPDHSSSHHEFSEGSSQERFRAAGELHNIKIDSNIARAAERAMTGSSWIVQRRPAASDPIRAWLAGSTVDHLLRSGILTVGDLCDAIGRKGTSWWKPVAGLGPARADRIERWFKEVEIDGVTVFDGMFDSVQRKRLVEKVADSVLHPPLPDLMKFELDPLSPYIHNVQLSGTYGTFRNRGNNMARAETDVAAIIVALGKYADKRHTLKTYSRAICRLCLWSYRIKQMPVSSLGISEARQYREFLSAIPSDWIDASGDAVPRGSQEWKPFRGQLGQSSQRTELTSINVILRQLMEAGYLSGNPMSGVLKHAELKRPLLNPNRSFDLPQWEIIKDKLDEEINSAIGSSAKKFGGRLALVSAKRNKALVHTLHATGLRRDELFNARLGHIEKIVVDDETSYLLTVTGKRSKQRSAVLHASTMRYIREHLEDRPKLFDDDFDSPEGRMLIPLISVLSDTVSAYEIEEGKVVDDIASAHEAVSLHKRSFSSASGALGVDGMKSSLKSFLSRCVATAIERNVDVDAFKLASLHWLRHTFGRSMVDAGVDMRVVQRAMGHSSINTTASYARADELQMIRGIRAGAMTVDGETK